MSRIRRVWLASRFGTLSVLAAFLAAASPPSPALGAEDDEGLDVNELAQMSIEDLMRVEVTSVSGTGEEWFRSPASLYVITNEDVRRTGHLYLAEALRLAPGVFVGQSGSHGWSIGARGFNAGLANKTLVLIDGRTVYDPLFSGTFWDVQDVLLEDLDRIEVIRGPGPTLWGSNAMNGVFNVTTRSAKDTQGFYLSGGVGDEERGFGMTRYGGKINDSVFFRVWGKYLNRDDLVTVGGGSAHDEWDMGRGGFRLDAEDDESRRFTVQGEVYGSDRLGEAGQVAVPNQTFVTRPYVRDARAEGGHLLARVSQEQDRAGWSLQAYYDRTARATTPGFQVERETADLDFRHHFKLGERNELLWGLGLRHTSDETEPGAVVAYFPESRDDTTLSAFVQDTITLAPDRLFAMIGSKFEHNDYTGFEVQPSARLWWTPGDRHTLWGAITRAVRVPSRTEEDSRLTFAFADEGLLGGGAPTGTFRRLALRGDDDVDAEELTAYELGYRVKATDNLTFDTSVFFNDYRRLLSAPPEIFGRWNNDGAGETFGLEALAKWRVAHNWRLEAGYSFTRVDLEGPILLADEGNTPRNMAQLRSYLDVTKDLELNGAIYYVDNVTNPDIDAYTRLDVGVTWRPRANVELSLWGQNLLDPGHPEITSIEAERGVYFQATFRY